MEMPTGYFEAKPQRAVRFDEVKYAVVPETLDENIKKQLSEYGVQVVEYENGNEEDRTAKLNSLDDSNALCRNCLTPLEQTPHKRKRMFCSDACRMAWWNAHPERVQRKAYYTLTCRHCGKQYESYGNSHRVFCSRDCYLKFRRKEADHE